MKLTSLTRRLSYATNNANGWGQLNQFLEWVKDRTEPGSLLEQRLRDCDEKDKQFFGSEVNKLVSQAEDEIKKWKLLETYMEPLGFKFANKTEAPSELNNADSLSVDKLKEVKVALDKEVPNQR